MNTAHFKLISDTYVAAEAALALARAELFPHHSVVRVDCPRYHGEGLVVVEDGCRPHELSVLLENGNVWRYPAAQCEPITDRALWPQWIRRKKAKWTRIENSAAKNRTVEAWAPV